MKKLILPLLLLGRLPSCAITGNHWPWESDLSITGRVVDHRKNPVSGVQVQAQGFKTVLTNSKGEFTLAGAAPRTDRLPVNFMAPGFVNTTRVYKAANRVGGPGTVVVVWPRVAGNGNTVVIWPRAAAVTLDATRGGKVPFRNGGGVTLPEGALIDSNGKPVSGNVRVSLTYLDVTNREQLQAAPGDFTARMSNGGVRALESFGIFEISVNDLQGRPVNLMRGKTARLELPVPRRRTAPSRTGLFSFDQRSGRWIEEGNLTLAGNTITLTATINQVNVSWNADNDPETTCMTVRVINPFSNPPNQPEANALVEIRGVNYSSIITGTTDSNGLVCLSIKRCSPVTLEAYSSQNFDWVSVPQNVTASCGVASASDCGNPQKCPVVTVILDLITGRHKSR